MNPEEYIVIGNRIHHVDDLLVGWTEEDGEEYDVSWQ